MPNGAFWRAENIVGDHAIGRVIARPFKVNPVSSTVKKGRIFFSSFYLLYSIWFGITACRYGLSVVMDIFSEGSYPPSSVLIMSIMEAVSFALDENFEGLLWANLIDFDMSTGTETMLMDMPQRWRSLIVSPDGYKTLKKNLLVITADHGCDPAKGRSHRGYAAAYLWAPCYSRKPW